MSRGERGSQLRGGQLLGWIVAIHAARFFTNTCAGGGHHSVADFKASAARPSQPLHCHAGLKLFVRFIIPKRGFVRKWEDFRRLLSHIEIVPLRALNDFKGCGLQQPPDTGQAFPLPDLWVVSSRICGQKGFPHLPRNPHGLVGEIVSFTWRHRLTSPSTPSDPPSQG